MKNTEYLSWQDMTYSIIEGLKDYKWYYIRSSQANGWESRDNGESIKLSGLINTEILLPAPLTSFISDEEIEEYIGSPFGFPLETLTREEETYDNGIRDGAKWMRDKLALSSNKVIESEENPKSLFWGKCNNEGCVYNVSKEMNEETNKAETLREKYFKEIEVKHIDPFDWFSKYLEEENQRRVGAETILTNVHNYDFVSRGTKIAIINHFKKNEEKNMSACCYNYPNCLCGGRDNKSNFEGIEIIDSLFIEAEKRKALRIEEAKRIEEAESLTYDIHERLSAGKPRNKMTHLIPKKKKRK